MSALHDVLLPRSGSLNHLIYRAVIPIEELSAEERRDLKNDIRLLIRKQCLIVSSRKDDFIHRLYVISCPLSVVSQIP